MVDAAQKLAWFVQAANEKYATTIPPRLARHMTNTDSTPFMDLVPAISLRENERVPRSAAVGSALAPGD
jgi:hypothetical protein